MAHSIDPVLLQRARLTGPDFITYVPSSTDKMALDGNNEHFLTFDGPDGSLLAIWTQSWYDPVTNHAVNRTMFARSDDEGASWSEPRRIAGPKDRSDPTFMTSWAFPIVTRSGRIYVIYNAHKGVAGWTRFHTGSMAGIYSDDCGVTWSLAEEIPMPISPYDDPEGKVQPEWIVWQKPMRDLSGGYFVGFSHWVNKAATAMKAVENWTQIESVCEFMRFPNIEENPAPRDICVRYSPPEKALRAPSRDNPPVSPRSPASYACPTSACSACFAAAPGISGGHSPTTMVRTGAARDRCSIRILAGRCSTRSPPTRFTS